jgi:xanthine dehydrogenase large subunit
MLAISVYEALRDAVASTKAAGELVNLVAPATAENVWRALRD